LGYPSRGYCFRVRSLSISRDGQRLVLVLPDELPLRVAAKALAQHRYEGSHDGHVVFTYPVTADLAREVVASFEPSVAPAARPAVDALLQRCSALEAAQAEKSALEGAVGFDHGLRTLPMQHQIQAMRFCWARFQAGARGAALLMEQGTGKSLVAIGLAHGLWRAGETDHALVVCPNSLKGTWGGAGGEIPKHLAAEPWIEIPDGSRERRAERAEALIDRAGVAAGRSPWVILNYEMFAINPRQWPDWLRSLDSAVQRGRGLLILDESSMLKNLQAKRTRTLQALARHYRNVLILTGTPVTKSPLDIYAQFEVMEAGALGFRSYFDFERTYARYQRQHFGGRQVLQVVGYQNLDDLERRVARHSFRARAEDCLDLPPVRTQTIPVELSPAQGMILRQLARDTIAEMDDGSQIDGRNVLSRYLRMAQVVGGFAATDAGTQALAPNPKLEALGDFLATVLEDPDHKAVIFARFTAEIDAICTLAHGAGWNPARFDGQISPDERELWRRSFDTDPSCRVLVAQYQTGSYGLNLTVANTIAFYSLDFSLEHLLQARKRVHRQGQTRPVLEAYFLGHVARRQIQTIDHLMLRALSEKKNLADIVTGDRGREMLEAL